MHELRLKVKYMHEKKITTIRVSTVKLFRQTGSSFSILILYKNTIFRMKSSSMNTHLMKPILSDHFFHLCTSLKSEVSYMHQDFQTSKFKGTSLEIYTIVIIHIIMAVLCIIDSQI